MIEIIPLVLPLNQLYWGTCQYQGQDAIAIGGDDFLVALGFIGKYNSSEVLVDLAKQLKIAKISQNNAIIAQILGNPVIKIALKGTIYQQKIWHELLKIPSGQTTEYGEIAKKINSHPRAVGMAIGKNLISGYIPCHRVLNKNHEYHGYRWGINIKKILIESEKNV